MRTSRAGLFRRTRTALMACVACVTLAAALPAHAAEASKTPTRSATTTVTIEGYDVDFSLPTSAKAGCMVCHGDVDLIRLRKGEVISFWVDPTVVDASAHAGVQCTGCHLDFAYSTPHVTNGVDWQAQAKTACQNCHLDQSVAVSAGAHRAAVRETTTTAAASADRSIPLPLCGDCHGSHAIEPLTDYPSGQAAIHARGREVCGDCHQDYWDNYSDYYHGAAYKRGAKDAPSCWDCHGWHDVRPSDDKDSKVNERHLVETCAACHKDANESYVAYAKLVHRRGDITADVILYTWIMRLRDALFGLFGG